MAELDTGAIDHLKQCIPKPAPEISPDIQDATANFNEIEYEDPQAGQHS